MLLTEASYPKIGVGLIGYGLGGVTHAALAAAEPRMQLVSVATSDAERTTAVSERHPDVAVVRAAAEVIENPDVELVVVATPNVLHWELTMSALKADKHVVVDKPFSVTSAEADEMIACANQQSRMLTVFHNRRWDADFLTVQRCITDGSIGRVHTFVSSYDRYAPDVQSSWREMQSPGTGRLYDLGAHLIDQAFCLFGLPRTISADIRRQRAGSLADDYFHLLLDYPEVAVVLHAGALVRHRGPRFEVHGDHGTFLKTAVDPQSAAIASGAIPGGEHWGEEDPTAYGTLYTEIEQRVPSVPGNYAHFYRQVAAAIRDGESPPVLPFDAREVVRAIECALQSDAEGVRVQFCSSNGSNS